jgi:uncharacterized protein (TIGR03083 family)
VLQHRAPLDHERVVAALTAVSESFLATLAAVTDWEAPGLGEWTVRELAAHTLRAFTTVETYLDAPLTDDSLVPDATEYYHRALGGPDVHAAVAARGREAGQALTAPLSQATEIAARVLARIRDTGPDRVTHSIAGPIALTDYLATRTVELTLHTLDLQSAIGSPRSVPADAVALCLAVLMPLADPTELLLSLAGRTRLHVLG